MDSITLLQAENKKHVLSLSIRAEEKREAAKLSSDTKREMYYDFLVSLIKARLYNLISAGAFKEIWNQLIFGGTYSLT